MQLPRLIGLAGYAQSGKDTVASRLPGAVRIALADPIRSALLALNPLLPGPVRLVEALESVSGDWEALKRNPAIRDEFRRLMQAMGTEVGRNQIAERLWLDKATEQLKKVAPAPVVITDIRFTNEAQWLQQMGGYLIEVSRPGIGPANGHVSENPIPRHLIHAHIINDGTLEDLDGKIVSAVDQVNALIKVAALHPAA